MQEVYTADRDKILSLHLVSAEHKPVFQEPVPLQPEQQNPETINLLPKKEGFQEEKMAVISKQLTVLKLLEMHGATVFINKENFPDIPEERLETYRYFADSTRIAELQLKIKSEEDEALKAGFQQDIAEIKEQRTKRSKEFREKTKGKPIVLIEPSKTEIQKPTPPAPAKILPFPGQYL